MTRKLSASSALLAIFLVGCTTTAGRATGPSTSPTSTSAGPSATPTSAPPIPTGWHRRAGVQSAFQLAIPNDWKGGWFEGTWDFEPKGEPSTAEGGSLFAVTVTVQSGGYEQPANGKHATQTTVNGAHALTWATGQQDLWYSVEWAFCPGYASECSSNRQTHTLVAHMFASTRALWERYFKTGKTIVSTIAPYDGSTPAHGTVSAKVGSDTFTKALVRFMDARVEGIGADELMTQHGAADYENIGLYSTGIPSRPYVSFALTEATQRRAGSRDFSVNMFIDPNEWSTESVTLKPSSAGGAPAIDAGVVVSRSNQD